MLFGTGWPSSWGNRTFNHPLLDCRPSISEAGVLCRNSKRSADQRLVSVVFVAIRFGWILKIHRGVEGSGGRRERGCGGAPSMPIDRIRLLSTAQGDFLQNWRVVSSALLPYNWSEGLSSGQD